MKIINRKKIKTIHSSDPEEFDALFNEASEQMSADYTLIWDAAPMTVHFIYEELERIAESYHDEFVLEGKNYYCKDCPYFQRGKNKRLRSKGCKFGEFGEVKDFTPACELFCKKVKEGKLKPVEDK